MQLMLAVMNRTIFFLIALLPFRCLSQNPCHDIDIIIDNDSNVYHSISLGTQCWLQENMRSTHTRNGDKILVFNPNTNDSVSLFIPLLSVAGKSLGEFSEYGYLYTWNAAQQVCPKGWHLPSLQEWEVLFQYVGADSLNWCGGNEQNISKALASKTTWNKADESEYDVCDPATNPSNNNSSGFDAKPAGIFFYDHIFKQLINACGFMSCFWTGTFSAETRAYIINVSNESIIREVYPQQWGMSVRCIMD